MKLKQTMLLLFLILLLFVHCDTTEPPTIGSLTLRVEEVSCTEAWLQLKSTNLQLPNSIAIRQNNQIRMTINLATSDTLLYIDSLLPNKSYNFSATYTTNNLQLTTNEVLAQTLDTTSHNFTWQTWTFGEHSSSVLYDVAIINENNIWAVGEIYMNDSLGQPDPHAYNAVHWDGGEWKVQKITVLFRGNLITPPLEGVFTFSSTDIWFVGSLPIHGDGNNWTMYDLRTTVDPNLSLSKAWGASSNNIYFVGRNGSIAHYNGNSWTKIESGTSLILADIIGVVDGNGGYNKYLAAGDAMFVIDNQNLVRTINLEPNMFVNLLWGMYDNLIYTAGNGVVLYKNKKWEKINSPDVNTVYGIRGNNYNNIFGLSSTLAIIHFNGFSWQYINTGDINIYYILEVKDNLTVAVGWRGDKATLTLLHKN